MKHTSVSLPADVHARLAKLSGEMELSVSYLISRAVREFLERQEPPPRRRP